MKRASYMIVVHKYWMDNIGWERRILHGVTEREAKGEASLLADSFRYTFQHADYIVIPLQEVNNV